VVILISVARLAGLEEELNLTSTQYQVSSLPYLQAEILTVSIAQCFDPIRRLYFDAEFDPCSIHRYRELIGVSSLKYVPRQDRKTVSVSTDSYDYLGYNLRGDGWSHNLWRIDCMPVSYAYR
jgi:hypothetical protein